MNLSDVLGIDITLTINGKPLTDDQAVAIKEHLEQTMTNCAQLFVKPKKQSLLDNLWIAIPFAIVSIMFIVPLFFLVMIKWILPLMIFLIKA